MEIEYIDFKVLGDDRGSLISLESQLNIPFEIKRVYYIFKTKDDARRGLHAHKRLNQVMICLSGSCKLLLDDGISTQLLVLNSPIKGVKLGNMIWREMFEFSNDCVLMVLANELYDETDYIRRYEDFLEAVKNKQEQILEGKQGL